jgi:hypothetical protein
MTEGYFVRIDTGRSYLIHDHEIDVRKAEFAKQLGIPDQVFKQFPDYEPVKDREVFLRWLLGQVPLARVRGYGVWAGIQWGYGSDKEALQAIHRWGKKVCGPCLYLRMLNLTTRKQYDSFWLPFDTVMRTGTAIKTMEVTK